MDSNDLRVNETRIEVMKLEDLEIVGGSVDLIAVGYHHERQDLEATFRKANALFDTPIPSMSSQMKSLCDSAHHRVAILELKL